ncbi:MAG: hypothetical protein ACPG31_01675 [Planctomycetota bacterium]
MKSLWLMTLVAGILGAGCQQSPAPVEPAKFESSILQPDLTAMEPVQLHVLDQGTTPQQGVVRYMIRKSRENLNQYPLHFYLDEKRSRVVGKNLTPSTVLGPRLYMEESSLGDWSLLLMRVLGSDSATPMAAWQVNESGNAVRVHLRRDPCIEWKYDTSGNRLQGKGKVSILWRPFPNEPGDRGWQVQS